jgi:hypothetical protein
LIPSPIGKVLSTIRKHRVRALLMGGQACILYGAAEFSRDIDLAILADEKNLDRLARALRELQAEPVYYPALAVDVLQRGHACHFRLHGRELEGLRLDVMSVMHGCAQFAKLWARRRRITIVGIGSISLLSLPDLVQAKKTQRDKDWPMLRRLVEADYHNRPHRPSRRQILFWLREARTPELLLEICNRYPTVAQKVASARQAVQWASRQDLEKVAQALRAEEDALRAADRAYWAPLRAELFQWRTDRR